MARALQRILRFRQLAEEQARLEVERGVLALRQANAACERQIATERRQRSTLAESWKPEARTTKGEGLAKDFDPNQPLNSIEAHPEENSWLMEEAALEFLGWTRMRLEQFCELESRRIEPLIERYKEHRRELRQTEQLLAQQTAIENMEKNRRVQAETDEWFLQRSLADRRRAHEKERAALIPRNSNADISSKL